VSFLLLIRILRLIEEEIGRKLLVLVASEVGLDDQVAGKAEAAQLSILALSTFYSTSQAGTYPFNSLTLLLGNADRLSPGRQWGILVRILSKQLEELLRILVNQLRQLRVSGANLLQDRLKHLGLLLHDLS
jgi:hypothetical protein